MTELSVQVGGRELVVALDTAGAPRLTAALLAALPHRSIAVHAATAGAEFCVPVPFFQWHENRRTPVPGDVGYASFGNYLCFYYGPMAAVDGPTNVVGQVTGGLRAIESLGVLLLRKGAQETWVRPQGGPAASAAGLPALTGGAAALAHLSRSLLQATLEHPPADVAGARRARLPAMGNIAGRFQVCGLLLSLAELLMQSRTALAAGTAEWSRVAPALADQAGRYSRWLAMAGMAGTAAWLARLERALQDAPGTGADYVAGIAEALVALGRLRFWMEAITPWHRLADDYGNEAEWLPPMGA